MYDAHAGEAKEANHSRTCETEDSATHHTYTRDAPHKHTSTPDKRCMAVHLHVTCMAEDSVTHDSGAKKAVERCKA